jgi:hypothetical protein
VVVELLPHPTKIVQTKKTIETTKLIFFIFLSPFNLVLIILYTFRDVFSIAIDENSFYFEFTECLLFIKINKSLLMTIQTFISVIVVVSNKSTLIQAIFFSLNYRILRTSSKLYCIPSVVYTIKDPENKNCPYRQYH